MAPPKLLLALLLLLASSSTSTCTSLSSMGPLMLDTTDLDVASGGCVNAPGDSNAVCTDVGVVVNASACSDICESTPYCSAITYHGPTTQEWANHCVLRKDNVWVPRACGAGCDHTAAQKVSGWVPYTVPWIPTTKGYTSRPKIFWFGANSSGLDNPDTLSLIAAHDVGGYGWQTGHPGGGSVGLGEMWQGEATENLQTYLSTFNNTNRTMVFQYRQIQVALRLFAQCALAADDPANAGFFLADPKTGATCLASQPWGTADPYWTFTNASAIDYFVDNVIGGLLKDPTLTAGNGAVFFDECDQGVCGYRGGTCDFSQFNATNEQIGYNNLYAQMVAALNGGGIVPILSLDNRMTASSDGLGPSAGPPCALPQDDLVAALANLTWARFYETWPGTFWAPNGPDTDAAMIQNAILEAEAGIPNILHTGGGCPAPDRNISRPGPLGGDIEFAIASYLIVQSPGTTLSISNDWYDNSFCWRPDFNVDFGTPVGPPIRTSPHSWTRVYTRANATVDVSSGRNGQVYLLA
jgi:hypothetical protein